MDNKEDLSKLVLPDPKTIRASQEILIKEIPQEPKGEEYTIAHIRDVIVPSLNHSSQSPHYYGFVTGGATRESQIADNIVTEYDQNVQVHLPNETIATNVEDCALRMLCKLLDFDDSQWTERTFTTGATASNVLGLAVAREFLLSQAASRNGVSGPVNVGELGLHKAMQDSQLDSVQILSSMSHSSISKAASIVGFGRSAVKNVGLTSEPWRIDIEELEKQLQKPLTATIIVISCGEVNTGRFATGRDTMRKICKLRAKYQNVWIHVDGAFGIMGRILREPEYQSIIDGCAEIEQADSITGDCHKLLNVVRVMIYFADDRAPTKHWQPYDCGFFLCNKPGLLSEVFKNPGAAYLASKAEPDGIQSPLNIGIENSRRFRALPVYANLVSYGVRGLVEMLQRQIRLARAIAKFIQESEHYEILPRAVKGDLDENWRRDTFVVVLFRAKDDKLNESLAVAIQAQRKIYVSGTKWDGMPACRFAISNWQASVERDMPVIKNALEEVAKTALQH